MSLGQGLLLMIQQFFYRDSTVVMVKMVAPARRFVRKRDTFRWRIALNVKGKCQKMEYRRIYAGSIGANSLFRDSLICSFKGDRYDIVAELSDENAGEVIKTLKERSLPQKKNFLLSSLNYEYSDSGVVLSLLISPKKRSKFKVRFGLAEQWGKVKMYDLTDFITDSDTTVNFLIPKSELSYGEITFIGEVNGLRRETEILFNQFNLLNDKDFKVLLSVLNFVFSPRETEDLSKAPSDKRQDAWDKFWESKGGKAAEREFMERLYTALRLFPSSFRKKVSDRALIYTKFGPPDNVESYPYRLEGKPYEIWYYYRIGKTFVFVDMDGTGDYRLVPESYIDIMR